MKKKITRYVCLGAAAIMTAFMAPVVLSGCGAGAAVSEEADAEKPEEQSYVERLESCKAQIEERTDFKPDIVLVLGTGLGGYADTLDVKETIPYSEIEGWPKATAPEHAGNLVFGEYKGLKIAVMQGRIHYYEGYSMEEVVLPLRVLHMLGAETAILSNATGSLNKDFKVGEFVCVEDQISSFIPSPLIGDPKGELGDRFVGMTDVFDKDMRAEVLSVGKKNDIPVHSGIYIQVTGPQYETPAEIRMYRKLGADTVAMSLCDETLAASQMHMKVCAINVVSNMAAGMDEGFDEESVEGTMKEASKDFKVLMDGLLDSLT